MLQSSVRATSPTPCRVACLTDTFGLQDNNGVARFLSDLHVLADQHGLPFTLVAPGKQDRIPGVHFVRAPSFTPPGYRDLRIAMPLEHQRQTILREMREWRPDTVHVSTPGPFGCFGVSIAQQLRLPLVGIYHTDFPSYAKEIVTSQLRAWTENPGRLWEATSNPLVQAAVKPWLDRLRELGEANPQLDADLEQLCEIGKRNFGAWSDGVDFIQLAGGLASSAMTAMLKRFYAKFTLVIARSAAQRDHLRHRVGIDDARIRCLTPGTDVAKFHPRFADRESLAEFGLPSNAIVSLYVGRLTSEKNFEFLLSAWRELQKRTSAAGPQHYLLVVGHGDAAAAAKAEELSNVRVADAQHGERLSRIYASADVVLFPSNTETLGQVGLEAGASGTPAIVSDEGGPKTYVRDGATGFVLPTRDPAVWAECVLRLGRDDALRRTLGSQARAHIAGKHTLDDSIRSYWALHSEAAEVHRGDFARERTRIATRTKPPAGTRRRPGMMIISDYHAGKRFGTDKHRLLKESAFEKMLQRAVDKDLRLVYAGDFGDHGARPERREADFAALRQVQKRVGLESAPLLIRGNHDYGFTDEQLTELTGGCRVHDSLVYTDVEAGVTVTHGHILGLHRVLEVIREADSAKQIEALLREEALDEELKPSVIAYDLANLVESHTRQMGLTGLGSFWEGMYKTRSVASEAILAIGKSDRAQDERTWKLIASLVGSHDDVQTAGQLGAACRSWATVFGHTHEPLAQRLTPDTNGQEPTHLVANSGNINRKRPCCVVVRYPEVWVYRYRSETGKLQVTHRAWLEPDEIDAYEAWLKQPEAVASCD